jgi:hypothetical protein
MRLSSYRIILSLAMQADLKFVAEFNGNLDLQDGLCGSDNG